MGILRISLLGQVQVSHDDRGIDLRTSAKMTRVPQLLLAYLVLQPQRAHRREVLAALLWGDRSDEQARNCLNTALWRLRAVLEPQGVQRGAYLLTSPAGDVSFNHHSDFWLDTALLERYATRALARPVAAWSAEEADQLCSALQLYHGDLLEGCYEDWALRERERLRDLFLRSLARLLDYYTVHGDLERGVACARQILYHDPLREEVHRELIALYLHGGQRALALRQYEECRDLLARELGVPPMEETQQLIAGALRAPVAVWSPLLLPTAPGQPTPPGVEQVLHQFHLALQHLEETHAQFRQAFQQMEQFLKHTPPTHPPQPPT